MTSDITHSNPDGPHFRLTLLNNVNYPQWRGEMRAVLQRKKLWQLVIGKRTRPADNAKAEIWDEDASVAAGDIFLGIQLDQRILLNDIAEDPVKMWLKLESVHLQKHAGTRFNAYNDLFAIRMSPDESLQSLMNRVDQAIIIVQNLVLRSLP